MCNSPNDYNNSIIELMLESVRASIFDFTPKVLANGRIDWDELMDISAEHGLLAWVWDGICKIPQEQQPTRIQRINWGLSAQDIWDSYFHHQRVLGKIIEICDKKDIKVLLLKGIELSSLYPKPQYRPAADIDIYFFDNCIEGVELLSGGKYELSGKHYTFWLDGVHIECHEKLIDVGTDLQIEIEKYLESTLYHSEINENGFYVLPFWSNIVHTLLHNLAHLTNPGPDPIKIRSILDYAMLLEKVVSNGRDDEYKKIMKRLNLQKQSDLFIALSEWIMNDNYSCLYSFDKSSVLNDLERAKLFLSNNKYRYPTFDNSSFYKQLIQRFYYHRKTRWRFSYLPSLAHQRLMDNLKMQFHLFIKTLFGFPFEDSFWDSLKKARKSNR